VAGGVAYFFFASVPLFLAYSANLIDPALVERLTAVDSQLVLPTLVLERMPVWLQVVFFGALLSVIMSTASGTLLAPAVTFAENVLRPYMKNQTDQQFLNMTRLLVAVFAAIVTGYAVATDATIHTMVENAYRITLAGAFVPLAAGLFWKRATNRGAALSVIFGLGTWLVLEFLGVDEPVEPQLFGLLAAAVGMVVGSLSSRPSAS
jgi:Na+/proline symporter